MFSDDDWGELRECVIEACDDDYVYFAEIMSIIKEVAGPRDDLLERAGEVAGRFVEEGLIVPGELRRTGFVPWPGAPGEAAERIRGEVAEMVRDRVRPTLGSVCWFVLGEAAASGSPTNDSTD